ncbi:MAG: 2TM domain-containing protein [Nitrospiraceae bacterium]|nr:MAG: 2TM domain-containing protein [Nitrospiraceae bacterium]
MEDQGTYEKAKKRVEAKMGFYVHLAIFVAVNILLIINYTTSPQNLSFKWPLIGWGIGILFYALSVFVFSEGSSLKEQLIKKEMQRDTRKKWK